MKQLSSFMVLNIDGGDRVTYTYNKIEIAQANQSAEIIRVIFI